MPCLEAYQNETLTIVLQGELDHHNAAFMVRQIEDALDRFSPARLLLDFSGVTFMDSSGIGVVLGRYKLCHARGIALELRNMSKMTERIFNMAGVLRLIQHGGGERP